MSRVTGHRAALASVLVLGLVVVSCGGDDDASRTTTAASSPDDGTGAAAATPAPSDGTGTPPPSAETDPDYDPDARFVMGYSVAPSSLDPHKGTSQFDTAYLYPVYDRLTYLDPAGEPQPMLATEWELDGDEVTMTLREGVVFHDGAPFNAEAVKANFDRMLDDPESTQASSLAVVDSAEVVDEYTVRLSLTGPGGPLPVLLGGFAGMMISPAAFENPDLDLAPVGAGAYKFVEYQPGARLVFDRFEDYWDPSVQKLAGFEFVVQGDDQARVNALISGQIDVTNVREALVEQVEASPGVEVLQGPWGLFYGMQLNADKPPFDDPNVRLAMQHAIDREALVDAAFFGLCTAEVQPWPAEYYPYHPDYTIESAGYDPDLTRQLLADAGYADGFSVEVLLPNITAYEMQGTILQEQLREFGIDLELRPVEAAQSGALFQSGEGAITIGAGAGQEDPSLFTATEYVSGGGGNPADLTTEEIEALHLEAMESPDPADRGDVYREQWEKVWELGPTQVVFCTRVKLIGHRDNVRGLEVYVTGGYDFRNVYKTS